MRHQHDYFRILLPLQCLHHGTACVARRRYNNSPAHQYIYILYPFPILRFHTDKHSESFVQLRQGVLEKFSEENEGIILEGPGRTVEQLQDMQIGTQMLHSKPLLHCEPIVEGPLY